MRTREITLGAVVASLVFAFLPLLSNSAQAATKALPTGATQSHTAVSNPANQPEDLVALARVETQSVVTVQCSNEVGSGWSADVDLNSQLKSFNYQSYVITNYHVVKGCLQNQAVQITLINQSKVTGYVWAWDEIKDVASIATTAEIPALSWTGDQPASGWWVGILGSPLGFPGVLTEGIISSINPTLSTATTSASINPGNSGGPAFDRYGRVIGLATAKYANSEGMGILNGTPLFCGTIVVCSSTASVWNTAPQTAATDQIKLSLSKPSVETTGENQLNTAALLLLKSSRNLLAQALEQTNAAIAKYPLQKNLLAQVLATTPKDPIIDNSVDDVLEVALFANEVAAFMKATSTAIAGLKASDIKQAPVAPTTTKLSPTVKKVNTTIVATIDPKISEPTSSVKKVPSKIVVKPKTITCVNLLKSVKVTAINAKCPLGYNLKVVITL
jgi:hypothetical protein